MNSDLISCSLAPKTLIFSARGEGGGDAHGKNVSGDPAHEHQYIMVGVNTPSFTHFSRIALVRVRQLTSSPRASYSIH